MERLIKFSLIVSVPEELSYLLERPTVAPKAGDAAPAQEPEHESATLAVQPDAKANDAAATVPATATREDAVALTTQVATTGAGLPLVVAVLREFGASRVSELSDADVPAYYAMLAAAAASNANASE